jgi:hypothetical protein
MDAFSSSVPLWVLAVLGVLLVLQITLDVIALVDLYRRPVDQIVLGNKWVWLVIILLVSTIGAILYLLAARKPAALTDEAAPPGSNPVHTDTIADTLYGPRDESGRP